MNIIFEAIVGSQAYSLNTKHSDVDVKGVYLQPNEETLKTIINSENKEGLVGTYKY